MITHHLHLHPQPFEYIRSGRKTVESRLFDEKRQTYTIGDKLVFTNRANKNATIETTITKLYKEKSFKDLFLNKDISGKFSTTSLRELLDGIELYYTKEDQEKYGVVGIEFIVNCIK